MKQIAVLFARCDSIYKALPECDVYDIDRDALTWAGGTSVVAHPPCRAWGRLRQFSKPRPGEKELALLAIAHVRRFGGVLEHPAHSSLWADQQLPRPGEFPDSFGGWTLEIEQFHFGHRAEKLTWLYIVGAAFDELPPQPRRVGKATHCIRPTRKHPRLPSVTKAEREHTPPNWQNGFARWPAAAACRNLQIQNSEEDMISPDELRDICENHLQLQALVLHHEGAEERMRTEIAQLQRDKVSLGSYIETILNHNKDLEEGNARLLGLIDTPHTADWFEGVRLEAAHQIKRWGAERDEGKDPSDWFWLIGRLAGKALHAAITGDIEKAKHHTISAAAVLLNWHRRITGESMAMRPGIEAPKEAA